MRRQSNDINVNQSKYIYIHTALKSYLILGIAIQFHLYNFISEYRHVFLINLPVNAKKM